MQIKSTLTNRSGQVLDVVYNDIESELDFKDKNIHSAKAYCFYKDKLVVVYETQKGYWDPPGGAVEPNEDVRNTVRREVQEETNMKVVKQRFIGYQEVFEPLKTLCQTRSVCIVETLGDFVKDPDGDISEIKLIDPKDYKQYFDWGEVGDRLMERALQAKAQMDLEMNYIK